MTISYYGHSCFKIASQGGHFTIITDPFDKKIGLNPPRVAADLVTISHDHYDHNNIKAVSAREQGTPFIINSPGEYEIKGINITGVSSFHDQQKGKERGQNTIYLIKMDGLCLCHLGDLGQKQLSDSQLEAIGQIDVLMIPIGGTYTISAKEAVSIVNQLEPSLVIPMHYKLPGLNIDLAKVDEFLHETGLEKKKPVEKLVVKKKDLTDKEMEVVVMKL